MGLLVIAVLLGQTAWSTFTTADGNASVSAPCVLTLDPTPPPPRKPGDPQMTSNMFSCTTPGKDEAYFIAWVDYEAGVTVDAAAELKANRDHTVGGTPGGTLATTSDVTYQGLPALDFTVNVQNRLLISSRVVVAGRRPYQIAAMTTIGKDRSEAVRRFLDSLTIKH